MRKRRKPKHSSRQELSCERCGEFLPAHTNACPDCGHTQSLTHFSLAPQKHLIFNVKGDLPDRETAEERLLECLAEAQFKGALTFKLVHGWGSGGQGGILKQHLRSSLDLLLHKKQIADYVTGEEFTHSNCSQILKRLPHLSREKDLERNNEGMCIVIL